MAQIIYPQSDILEQEGKSKTFSERVEARYVFSAILVSILVINSTLSIFGFYPIIILLIFSSAILALTLHHNINRKLLLFLVGLFLLLSFGYVRAVAEFGELVYPLRGFARYGSYACVFLLAYLSRPKIRTLYQVYGFLVLLEIPLALWQKFSLGMPHPNGTFQLEDGVGHALSYFLIPYFSISLIYFRHYFRATIVFVFLILQSGITAVAVALFIAGGYWLMHAPWRIRLLAMVLGPILLAAAGYGLEQRLAEQAENIVFLEQRLASGEAKGVGTFVLRVVTWKLMLEELQKHDALLLGRGMEYALPRNPNSVQRFVQVDDLDPHNGYLRVLLEYGLIGLAVFVAGYFLLARSLFRRRDDGMSMALGWTLAGFTLALGFSTILVMNGVWYMFFAFAGAAMARRNSEAATCPRTGRASKMLSGA